MTLSVRAPRAKRNGGKSIYRDIIGPGFGGSTRDARWVDARERAPASAEDAPSPWLQAFNCRHGYSPGASNRGGAMPIDGLFICLARPPTPAAESGSRFFPVTRQAAQMLLRKNREFACRFSLTEVQCFLRGSPLRRRGATPIEKTRPAAKAHLRRRPCHLAGASRTRVPSAADARDARCHSSRRVGARVAVGSMAKFIPFAGSAVAATISFGAMKLVGNSHVEDCYKTALALLPANQRALANAKA